MKHSILYSVIAFIFMISCKNTAESRLETAENEMITTTSSAMVPSAWVSRRVEKAKSRLDKSDAGKVVWNAMEAHGGLKNWYENGALAFRFNYQPLDGTPRDSYQVINTWSNKAKHTSIADSTAHYGWTGEKAWIQAKDSTAFAYDTRFWALTPYYFLAQPFVLDGEGVNLELLPEITFKDKNQDVVKVTFDQGTGDAPDDYYILYFDSKTHILSVIRYIVSYPAYFKEGEHMPEKFMELIGENKVAGISFPTNYETYWLTEANKPGEYITQIEVSDLTFKKELPEDYFEVPAEARIIDEL
jgi:hypothetical protein